MVKDRFAMQAEPSLRYFDGFSMKTLDNGYEVLKNRAFAQVSKTEHLCSTKRVVSTNKPL